MPQTRLFLTAARPEADAFYSRIEIAFEDDGFAISQQELDEASGTEELSVYVEADRAEEVEGRIREAVGDDFFPALRDLLRAMHARRIVYIDLHKRENVLVDVDGAPCLFDFQISVDWPRWLPLRPIFPILAGSDDYHLSKHWARCRPDQCGFGEQAIAGRRPWWIRAHRLIARPIREMRRRLLVRLGVRTGRGRVESEQFAEHALRDSSAGERRAA